MTLYTNPNSAIGESWGIASVNKAVTDDSNKMLFFRFILNGDETVTYNGTFYFSKTIYKDRYNNAANNIEQNTYINITDLKSIVRDYPTVTNLQLTKLFQRLLNTCIDISIAEISDLSGYVLCANLDGSTPASSTIPSLT